MPEQGLREWFGERPHWLQEVGQRIFDGQTFTTDEIAKLAIQESLGKYKGTGFILPKGLFGAGKECSLRLSSIGDIEGINALSPRSPLSLGGNNLTVIYGLNGSGKSGYVRLLKHLCGARQPGELHPNVFSATAVAQKCQISYEKDGAAISHEWLPAAGPVSDLCGVDIFDTQCGRIYASSENEVTYEPPVLSFLSDLIAISEDISTRLAQMLAELPSSKPKLPQLYANTNSGKWFNGISSSTLSKQITQNCIWTETNETEINTLQTRLAEKSPADKAKKLRAQKKYLDDLIKKLEGSIEALSPESAQTLLKLKQEVTQKTSAAETAAKQVFQNAPLDGIGSEVWKQLWEKARQYSEQEAYKEITYPNTGEGARCTLCQQPLSAEAGDRLKTFENYVTGALETEATEAKNAYQKAIEALPDFPTEASLREKLSACGWDDIDVTGSLIAIFTTLNTRQNELLKAEQMDGLSALPESAQWLELARVRAAGYETSALQFDLDAQGDNRNELQASYLELQAQKWTSQQQGTIVAERDRHLQINQLGEAKKLTNTNALSRKKGELAEVLITEAFVQSFNDELKRLGAGGLRVELVKTKVSKGRVLHKLRLCGAKGCGLEDVLSEGEFRIIALAAFFADVADKAGTTPFVFDDPISSLDQDYEEAVVKRLVQLAQTRQVIVFTHRLSLLGLIQDYGKKADNEPNLICVRQESWGAGEPGDTPLFAKKPEKALNSLINNRLPIATKMLEKLGKENYDMIAKGLCSEFRILLERMIESELLADVVQRYRRAVNTLGKLNKLARITEEDCKLFDDMMTKYSKYEHSQPGEAPVQIPLPDELKQDFEAMKEWRTEFAKRCAQ